MDRADPDENSPEDWDMLDEDEKDYYRNRIEDLLTDKDALRAALAEKETGK